MAGGFHQLLKFWKYSILPECESSASDDYFIDTGNARVDAEAWGEVAGSGVFLCAYLRHLGASPTSDEEKQYYYHPMGLERRCFCKRERCVEKIGPCKPRISPAEWTHSLSYTSLLQLNLGMKGFRLPYLFD